MTTTFKVRFWEIADWAKSKDKKKKKARPYGVRWVTERKSHSEWYATKALANSRRSELMQAAREGQPFDIESGLPVTELKRRNSLSFVEFAQSYMETKWPDAAAKTRTSTVDALATAGTVFVRDAAGRPEAADLRRVLISTLLPPATRDKELSPENREVVDWITRYSRPLYDLTDVVAMREVLDALATRLDGKSAAATVYRWKRAVLFNMLSYAVERELLPDNPMTKVKRSAPKMTGEVDPRVVANPAQVRQLLTAVTYVGRRNQDRGAHLTAFFAVGYKRWTDSGEVHDRRGLKHRGKKEVRLVQIPPVLVGMLREHLDRFGTGPDGRLFRGPGGGVVSSSTYSRVWDEARGYALTPSQVASPLARRPYDLRHAAVSLWLNRGVPAPEVAQRAGHSVDVLLKVYAKCVEGDRVKINNVVEDAFAE